jgi:hypothetical protein
MSQKNIFEGIELFVEWVKTQSIDINKNYENSLLEMRNKNFFKSSK